MNNSKKICYLCGQDSRTEGADLIHFGEWMTKGDITTHYFCLLLSTNLPQRGNDSSGILGFLLKDIRIEAQNAKSRTCKYCNKTQATIMCDGCSQFFHLKCGFSAFALFQFRGAFSSYCDKCIPYDDTWEKLKLEKPPNCKYSCFICMKSMGVCEPTRWIYGKCCGNGFVHSLCMKTYALKAGYYLRCIWCKAVRFREDVKDLGVFVPDRDASWEKDKGAYQELHRTHQRCDMETCNCPNGRDYRNDRKWTLIICQLCGSYGAHNPACIPGTQGKEKIQVFKCETCSATENTILSESLLKSAERDDINVINDDHIFDESDSSIVTIVNSNAVNKSTTHTPKSGSPLTALNTAIMTPKSLLLGQSEPLDNPKEFFVENKNSEASESPVPIATKVIAEMVFELPQSLLCQSKPLDSPKASFVENKNSDNESKSPVPIATKMVADMVFERPQSFMDQSKPLDSPKASFVKNNHSDNEPKSPDLIAIKMLMDKIFDLLEP